MKRIVRRIERLQDERREVALRGCTAIDALAAKLNPALLDALQYWLRIELVGVESQLRSWKDRRAPHRRRAWLRRYRERYGPLPLHDEHLKAVEGLEGELVHLRRVVRQLGDACAWLVLRRDARILRPLFAERPHRLPSGRGIVSVAQVVMEMNAIGRFLVLDNDLTRCIGDGDITVVRHDAPWVLPVTYELKAPGDDRPMEAGDFIDINFSAVHTGHPDQRALVDEITAAIRANEGHIGRPRRDLQRQEAGMRERAEFLREAARPKEVLAERENHWATVAPVLEDSKGAAGFAIAQPEPGIAYAAVRLGRGSDPAASMQAMVEQMRDIIPPGSNTVSSLDFAEDDRISASVLPVALWPLPVEQRADLLAGDVLFCTMFVDDVWERAFRAEGLTLTVSDGHWVVGTDDAAVELDPLDVTAMRLGVGLGATSPRSFARAVVERLQRGDGGASA